MEKEMGKIINLIKKKTEIIQWGNEEKKNPDTLKWVLRKWQVFREEVT